jgi:hypothetical protein
LSWTPKMRQLAKGHRSSRACKEGVSATGRAGMTPNQFRLTVRASSVNLRKLCLCFERTFSRGLGVGAINYCS